MKLSHLLPLVAASSALVIPSESVLREIQYEEDEAREWFSQLTAQKDRILKDVKQEGASYLDEAKSQFDELRKFASFKAREGKSVAEDKAESFQHWMSELFDEGKHAVDDYEMKWEEFDVDDYLPDREDVEVNLESYKKHMQDLLETGEDKIEMGIFGHHHGHHGHDDDDDDDHHHHPHHPHHPGHGDDTKNYTIYQLIANSEYSTTLAKLISKYPSIVDRLNSTKANHTVFAPTDKAFAKIPSKVLDKFSKKEVEALLDYHIVPGNYPASRLLFTQTAPTYLYSDHLASKPQRQRLTFKKGLGGLSVNFYARVVAPNIIGSNGVVHGVNSPIFPPIGAIAEIDLFPATFSTLELALTKTGLLDELNSTDHAGGTLFAPDNWAFEKLGPRINAFLFSKAGNKYLKALLLYHVVPDNTLYSDAYYHADPKDDKDDDEESKNLHVDLPTALEGKKLSIDISRWGPIVTIKVNGFNSVTVSDVPAEDGVIHVMTSVLIPPKTPKGSEVDGEMTVEELIERLEPLIDEEEMKLDL